jgi:hypothetical protein
MGKWVRTFSDPTVNIEGDLLDGVTGLTDGEWVDVRGYDKICLGLIVSATATVKVCGSMAIGQPDSSYHGDQIFPDKVYAAPAEELLAIKTPIRWLKARVTANTGTVSAPFIGV